MPARMRRRVRKKDPKITRIRGVHYFFGLVACFLLVYVVQWTVFMRDTTTWDSFSPNRHKVASPIEQHKSIDEEPKQMKPVFQNPFKEHETKVYQVEGIEAARQILESYNLDYGPLFLLFMSSKTPRGEYWCPDCEAADPVVKKAFQQSDPANRLLEIQVGQRPEWKTPENVFRKDPTFAVHNIPALLQWNGEMKTSNLIVEESCMDMELLSDYFKGAPAQERVKTVSTHSQLLSELEESKNMSTYIQFLGSKLPNGRFWSLDCDRTEFVVNSCFHRFAPSNSRLIKAIIADKQQQWLDESNPFRTSDLFQVKEFPSMARADFDQMKKEFVFTKYDAPLNDGPQMKKFFRLRSQVETKPERKRLKSSSRIETVQGPEEAKKFLQSYDLNKGPLYTLYTSDKIDGEKYWCPDCEKADKVVKDAFYRGRKDGHLLEVRVGNKAEWKNKSNDFRQDPLFYVDNIPTLMRYEGGNTSSNMLVESGCMNVDLLNAFFEVPNAPPRQRSPNASQIVHGHEELIQALEPYKGGKDTLIVYFISGNMKFGRPWCPYCEKADFTLDYVFNHTNSSDVKMLKVIVAETYMEWKNNSNAFRNSPLVRVLGIPTLTRINYDTTTGRWNFASFVGGMDDVKKLKEFLSPVVPQLVSVPLQNTSDHDGKMSPRAVMNTTTIVEGADAAIEYLTSYDMQNGPLYLWFMSDRNPDGRYWCPDCENAHSIVKKAFEAASHNAHLLEIRVGNQAMWKDQENAFRQNSLFYIDNIPALLRWEGNNKTSNLLTEEACTNLDLLNSFFNTSSKRKREPDTFQVITTYAAFESSLKELESFSGPLYVLFSSGRIENGRPWCPYCDKSEFLIEYYFREIASKNAKFVKVLVADSYDYWHNDTNPFRSSKYTDIPGIPHLTTAKYDSNTSKWIFLAFTSSWHDFGTLKKFFQAPELG